MILDTEAQRALLIQCIDACVPMAVRDASAQSAAQYAMLVEARAAIAAAAVAEAAVAEAEVAAEPTAAPQPYGQPGDVSLNDTDLLAPRSA